MAVAILVMRTSNPPKNDHTIGHWEGRALVMETVGLCADTTLQNTERVTANRFPPEPRTRTVASQD